MSELKITASHLRRAAVVYVRQSTLAQVERNTESTARQYDLATRAAKLGWPRSAVRVIDDDLGLSGASTTGRSGFAELAAQVGLGQVGIVLSLECSRLARNNADWYRLLDLAGMADTLIADADGVYHPALFNDRLLLGMKGTMSEAELHILRARLDGGIRNKAARGELRRGLPVGLVWGEADGEIGWHPDEAVTGLITAIFDRFAVTGSVRGVWLWLRDQGLQFPLQPAGYLHGADITWVEPTYHAVHNVLTHPGYAGAYVFGKTASNAMSGRTTRCASAAVGSRKASGRCSSQITIAASSTGTPTRPTKPVSATTFVPWRTNRAPVRSGRGCALQGLAICGRCGRRLAVYYDGPAKSTPGYYCTGTGQLVEGRGTRHLRVGGAAIDAAVAEAFLAALAPAALQACLAAARQLEDGHDAALAQWRRQVEQARYRAGRAERRYRAVDPDNRLVARALESEWNHALQQLADAEAELACRETARPKTLTPQEKQAILALGDDLDRLWSAPTTTDKDRKQLLRTLLEEVTISLHRDQTEGRADLVLRWKGGAITELSVPIKRKPPKIRTDEDTIDLLRRLAAHYPDAKIAGILNRQGRRTARKLSFTASRVQSLRHSWAIPCHQPSDDPQQGELLTVADAANQLGLAPSTLHRWLGEDSSPANSSPPAHPGGSGSPTTSARCSSMTPRGLAGHPRSNPGLRRIPPNPVAACQARRTPSRAPPHRTQKGSAHPATKTPRRPV